MIFGDDFEVLAHCVEKILFSECVEKDGLGNLLIKKTSVPILVLRVSFHGCGVKIVCNFEVLKGIAMKKILLLVMVVFLFSGSNANAGAIQYIDTGRQSPKIKVSFSRNNGASWKHDVIKKGQIYNVPRDATHLMINDIPRNPKRNYKVKDGNVF